MRPLIILNLALLAILLSVAVVGVLMLIGLLGGPVVSGIYEPFPLDSAPRSIEH